MRNRKNYYVYFITNFKNNVLYIGMTNNIKRRTSEHRVKIYPTSFSAKYKVWKLVYYEIFSTPREAIEAEKKYKRWHKEWKWNLIKKYNPQLKDLIWDLF